MALFERRQVVRMTGQAQVLAVGAEQAFLAEITDLSDGGCRLRRPRGWPFHINQIVRLYIFNAPGPAQVVDARIAWYQDEDMGMEFQPPRRAANSG